MRKWVLGLMVLSMLAMPMLACGFPFPAGTEMMQVSKTVCAEGEAPESCQARQDAYQLMSKLQAAAVPDLDMRLVTQSEDADMDVYLRGSYEYVLTDSGEGLGASVHVKLEEGEMTSAEGTETLSGIEFIIVGDKGYTSEDGGETWVYEELDEESLLGVGLFLGLGGTTGTGLDVYSDPATFAVTLGEPVEYEGQMMQVQTLTVDLSSLLMSPEALGALMEESAEAGGETLGMSEEDLGMSVDEFAGMAVMILPFLAGTEISTTLYIGEDGYIHYVADRYVLSMDMGDLSEDGAVFMSYELSGHITQHNEPLVIAAPEGATEGPGFLSEEGGLFGDSLFGPSDTAPDSTGCGGASTCEEMTSCAQAYACLQEGNTQLDADGDGVPCEEICHGG